MKGSFRLMALLMAQAAALCAQRPTRVDMDTFPRPIEMRDTVWIEEMTQLEIRDSLKLPTLPAP